MNPKMPARWSEDFKAAAAASAALRDLLKLHDPRFQGEVTHFLGDALPGEWAAAATNGISAAVTVAASQLTLTTGTTDNGYAGQPFGLFFKGDNGIFMESMQALDVLTTSKIEVGLTDALADAGAVNVKATPSATATDFGVLCRDTDDDTSLDLITQKATGVAKAATGLHTVATATNFKSVFRVENDVIQAILENKQVGGDGPIEGGTLLTPWWFAQARAGSASRVLTVEYAIFLGGTGLAV